MAELTTPTETSETETEPAPAPQPRPPMLGRGLRKLLTVTLFSLVGPGVIGVGALYIYVTGGRIVSTENAYVKADKVAVSADVSGRVVNVGVAENQKVRAGTLLFRIDQEPFRIALKQADARLAAARQTIDALKAEYRQKIAEHKLAEGDIKYYRLGVDRQRKLNAKGFASQSKLDDAEQNLRAARDRVAAIVQDIGRVRARLGGRVDIKADTHPTVLEALAERAAAELDLRRTDILAPSAGIVTNFGLEVGEYIEEGKPVFSLVGTEGVWVRANYKETELTHVRIGQPAKLRVDTYPDREIEAVVASIAPATGAEFALLPPQNASGNWVKVVQRLPVRLEITDTGEIPDLRAGMSVIVEIDTGHKRKVPGFLATAFSWMNERL
ncbi:MAG: HlyD family secretion protein [Magnetovibrio sp.]|nr:HlyD family secretion protein [Magnetovibrio sp.]